MTKDLNKLNWNKLQQRRKMLEADPHFQEVVLKIRSKWHILFDDPEREAILSKLPVRGGSFSIRLKTSKPGHHSITKENPMYKDVLKVLKQFQLSEVWARPIGDYILHNNFSLGLTFMDETETEPELIVGTDPISGLETLSLKLGRYTTLEDIKQFWPTVQLRRSGDDFDEDFDGEITKTRFRLRKNFERDCYIYKIYNQTGKKLSTAVLGLIRNKVLEKYKQDLDYGNIKKIVSVMKKELDKKPLH